MAFSFNHTNFYYDPVFYYKFLKETFEIISYYFICFYNIQKEELGINIRQYLTLHDTSKIVLLWYSIVVIQGGYKRTFSYGDNCRLTNENKKIN